MASLGRWRPALGLAAALLAAVALLAVSAGAERIGGTPKADHLHGGAKPDRISGRGGDDRLSGRRGNDVLRGGTGADELIGGKGFDALVGGPADDLIRARDGNHDQIECGGGNDRAIVDSVEDGVYDCEEVIEP